jgi:hypothetical protein
VATWKKAADLCGWGHPRTPENIYTRPNGQTSCRVCHNLRRRAHALERRQARAPKSTLVTTLAIRLPLDVVEELRRRAARLGVGPTQVARRLILDQLAALGDGDLAWDTSAWSHAGNKQPRRSRFDEARGA